MNAGRIRLNVGGTIFETTELTLGRLEGTMLKAMMDERWSRPSGPNNDELFIDRDATHFRTILNFLRDGAFTIPKCEREIAEIEREAEFYGISELAEACRSQRETVKVGDTVTWQSEVIELYWKAFVRFWVDDSLILPFVYERNNRTFARCIACDEVQVKHKGYYGRFL
uniref:BTB domain-containing protein n=1 Tax=Ascaris lumbricoides TaxID=6252 RepID=A0A0M3IKT6_ASCLU